MNWDWENRIRNYGFWTAIASLGLVVLHLAGVQIVDEKYWFIIDKILYVLIALGIINDPTTENRGFEDDRK